MCEELQNGAKHFRRIGPKSTCKNAKDLIHFIKETTWFGRNPNLVDFILDSADPIQSGMVSRRHARVEKRPLDGVFCLHDGSMNGVFINDIKIRKNVEMPLQLGDRVTFGHPNGISLQSGSRVPQPTSQYQFIFEHCGCGNDVSNKEGSRQCSPVASLSVNRDKPSATGTGSTAAPMPSGGSGRNNSLLPCEMNRKAEATEAAGHMYNNPMIMVEADEKHGVVHQVHQREPVIRSVSPDPFADNSSTASKKTSVASSSNCRASTSTGQAEVILLPDSPPAVLLEERVTDLCESAKGDEIGLPNITFKSSSPEVDNESEVLEGNISKKNISGLPAPLQQQPHHHHRQQKDHHQQQQQQQQQQESQQKKSRNVFYHPHALEMKTPMPSTSSGNHPKESISSHQEFQPNPPAERAIKKVPTARKHTSSIFRKRSLSLKRGKALTDGCDADQGNDVRVEGDQQTEISEHCGNMVTSNKNSLSKEKLMAYVGNPLEEPSSQTGVSKHNTDSAKVQCNTDRSSLVSLHGSTSPETALVAPVEAADTGHHQKNLNQLKIQDVFSLKTAVQRGDTLILPENENVVEPSGTSADNKRQERIEEPSVLGEGAEKVCESLVYKDKYCGIATSTEGSSSDEGYIRKSSNSGDNSEHAVPPKQMEAEISSDDELDDLLRCIETDISINSNQDFLPLIPHSYTIRTDKPIKPDPELPLPLPLIRSIGSDISIKTEEDSSLKSPQSHNDDADVSIKSEPDSPPMFSQSFSQEEVIELDDDDEDVFGNFTQSVICIDSESEESDDDDAFDFLSPIKIKSEPNIDFGSRNFQKDQFNTSDEEKEKDGKNDNAVSCFDFSDNDKEKEEDEEMEVDIVNYDSGDGMDIDYVSAQPHQDEGRNARTKSTFPKSKLVDEQVKTMLEKLKTRTWTNIFNKPSSSASTTDIAPTTERKEKESMGVTIPVSKLRQSQDTAQASKAVTLDIEKTKYKKAPSKDPYDPTKPTGSKEGIELKKHVDISTNRRPLSKSMTEYLPTCSTDLSIKSALKKKSSHPKQSKHRSKSMIENVSVSKSKASSARASELAVDKWPERELSGEESNDSVSLRGKSDNKKLSVSLSTSAAISVGASELAVEKWPERELSGEESNDSVGLGGKSDNTKSSRHELEMEIDAEPQLLLEEVSKDARTKSVKNTHERKDAAGKRKNSEKSLKVKPGRSPMSSPSKSRRGGKVASGLRKKFLHDYKRTAINMKSTIQIDPLHFKTKKEIRREEKMPITHSHTTKRSISEIQRKRKLNEILSHKESDIDNYGISGKYPDIQDSDSNMYKRSYSEGSVSHEEQKARRDSRISNTSSGKNPRPSGSNSPLISADVPHTSTKESRESSDGRYRRPSGSNSSADAPMGLIKESRKFSDERKRRRSGSNSPLVSGDTPLVLAKESKESSDKRYRRRSGSNSPLISGDIPLVSAKKSEESTDNRYRRRSGSNSPLVSGDTPLVFAKKSGESTDKRYRRGSGSNSPLISGDIPLVLAKESKESSDKRYCRRSGSNSPLISGDTPLVLAKKSEESTDKRYCRGLGRNSPLITGDTPLAMGKEPRENTDKRNRRRSGSNSPLISGDTPLVMGKESRESNHGRYRRLSKEQESFKIGQVSKGSNSKPRDSGEVLGGDISESIPKVSSRGLCDTGGNRDPTHPWIQSSSESKGAPEVFTRVKKAQEVKQPAKKRAREAEEQNEGPDRNELLFRKSEAPKQRLSHVSSKPRPEKRKPKGRSSAPPYKEDASFLENTGDSSRQNIPKKRKVSSVVKNPLHARDEDGHLAGSRSENKLEDNNDEKEHLKDVTNKAGPSNKSRRNVRFAAKDIVHEIPKRDSIVWKQEQERMAIQSAGPRPASMTLSSYRKKNQERVIDRAGTAKFTSSFLYDILIWNPSWLREQENQNELPPILGTAEVKPLQESYTSYDQYLQVMTPMLKLELWEQMALEWKRRKGEKKLRMVVGNIDIRMKPDFITYICQGLVRGKERCMIKEHDLVNLYLPTGRAYEPTKICWVMGYARHVEKTPYIDQTQTPIHQVLFQESGVPSPGSQVVSVVVYAKYRPYPVKDDQILEVQVISSLSTVMRQVRVMQNLVTFPLGRDLLQPVRSADVFATKPFKQHQYNKAYDEDQNRAISTMADAAQYPHTIPKICVLHGPPGTGKTATILGIIKQIIQRMPDARILLCAPSNVAADELMRRLILERQQMESKRDGKCWSIVRLGQVEEIHPDVRNFSLDNLADQNRRMENERHMTEIGKIKQQVEEIEKKAKMLEEERLGCQGDQTRHRQIGREIFHLAAKKREVTEHIERLEKSHPNFEAAKTIWCRQIIFKANVVCSTLRSDSLDILSEMLFRTRQEADKSKCLSFTCCIIDEASQCSEVDSLIPLSYNVNKLFLVGDKEGMPPVVRSQIAKSCQYGELPLMKRLLGVLSGDGQLAHQLRSQYRMHPDLCLFPLGGIKQSFMNVGPAQDKYPLQPYLLFDLAEDLNKSGDVIETDFICTLCDYLKQIQAVRRVQFSIGVITSCHRQKDTLRRRIQQKDIKVGTLESFQGSERRVIILSCSQLNSSTSAGYSFLNNRQSLNVACTRAKSAMFIIGHLPTLQENTNWASLLEYCEERQLVCHVPNRSSWGTLIQRCSKP